MYRAPLAGFPVQKMTAALTILMMGLPYEFIGEKAPLTIAIWAGLIGVVAGGAIMATGLYVHNKFLVPVQKQDTDE